MGRIMLGAWRSVRFDARVSLVLSSKSRVWKFEVMSVPLGEVTVVVMPAVVGGCGEELLPWRGWREVEG